MITRYASRVGMIAAPKTIFSVALGAILPVACVAGTGISMAKCHAFVPEVLTDSARQAEIVRAADPGSHSQPKLAGDYEGRAPAADAAQRRFTLLLAADGTAAWTTLYLGKNSTTERGHWTKDGSEIVLSFNPLGPHPPPAPITLRYRRHALWPVRWNKSEWGRAGPPVLYRSHSPTPSVHTTAPE